MKQIILGTAGHIDHGKTSLVKALTGTDTDRLKEEKERGITIELGFARLELPSGQVVGIVDVPGHERFVKNMVAGASGVDLVALVVAADEGVMPQTREHMDICSLLGVELGLVVLTKIDLVDEEWLELVTEDVASYLAGTFLDGAPIMPVSAQTGQGLGDLLQALDDLAARVSPKRDWGPFRLPADRVFTMRGFGTVLTGTALSGSVETGRPVTVYPEGISSRIRGLQVHGREVTEGRAGQRTAINLQGLEKSDLARGMVVADPDSMYPSTRLDVHFRLLPGAPRPLKHRRRVRLHAGTAEQLVTVILLDRDQVEPGDEIFAQLRLPGPLAVFPGDRFVLRSESPITTIGGGVFLDVAPPIHKRRNPDVMAGLERLRGLEPEFAVVYHLDHAGPVGLGQDDLGRRLGLTPGPLTKVLEPLRSSGRIVRFDAEKNRYVGAGALDDLGSEAAGILRRFHRQNPLQAGIKREELRSRLAGRNRELDPKLFGRLLDRLTKEGRVAADKDLVRLADHEVRLGAGTAQTKDEVLALYRRAGLAPPYLKEVAAQHLGARDVVRLAVEAGELIKVKPELFYDAGVMDRLKDDVRKFFAQNEKMSAGDLKDLTGLSRKYIIPLLEFFDSTRFTMRLGDHRVLRHKA
ncbi:MAG: selenocysteine-specific translation elongation factor [Proteobacteria bacterium]|nr:selenocysteine-specific translation elongation factor [Pseudomonadota bacterium]